MVLLANNILITYQFANGYILKDSTHKWDDRMHILINISSCGTLIGQAWTKTAFGITLLRMSNRWQSWILWFCIVSMNVYMVLKVIFQWAKVCGKAGYQDWYRLDFCIGWEFRDSFKEGGNGESTMVLLIPRFMILNSCIAQFTTYSWTSCLPYFLGSLQGLWR